MKKVSNMNPVNIITINSLYLLGISSQMYFHLLKRKQEAILIHSFTSFFTFIDCNYIDCIKRTQNIIGVVRKTKLNK